MTFKKFMGKESVGTAIGVVIFGWLWVESTLLSGEQVQTAVAHPVGQPLAFDVTALGEDYGITIDRPGRYSVTGNRVGRGKKRLKWRIEDPSGRVVLADNDSSAKATRFIKFTPTTTGLHTLIVDWDNSGFFKRHGTGMVTLLVNRDDKSVVMRWLAWMW